MTQFIRAILLGAILLGSVSATELTIKVRKVSHPDFDISANGKIVEKN